MTAPPFVDKCCAFSALWDEKRSYYRQSTCISFEILNQWISKRGFVISWNRIETKNFCLLNLWRQEFVIYNAAAAGSRHSRQSGSCWKRALPADRRVISPSVIATSRADTFLIRGRQGLRRSLAPPDGTHRRPCGAAAKSLILPSAVGKAD